MSSLGKTFFNAKDLLNLFNAYHTSKKFGDLTTFIARLNFTLQNVSDVLASDVKFLIDSHFGEVLGPIVLRNVEADIVQYGEIFTEAKTEDLSVLEQLQSLKRYDRSIAGGCECCGSWIEDEESKHGDWIKSEDVDKLIGTLKK